MDDKEFNWKKEKEKIWDDWAYNHITTIETKRRLGVLNKKFIKKLMEEICFEVDDIYQDATIINTINKLAGEKDKPKYGRSYKQKYGRNYK